MRSQFNSNEARRLQPKAVESTTRAKKDFGMKRRVTRRVFLSVPLLLLLAPAALGQGQPGTAQRVATNADWSVFTADSPKECWGASAPKSKVNTRSGRPATVSRGNVLLFVTFRHGGDPKGGVSFAGGYPFAASPAPSIDVGGKKYDFITQGDWAWPRVLASSSGLLDALKSAKEVTVTAYSTYGTKTEDTLSLVGFGAALEKARKECNGV